MPYDLCRKIIENISRVLVSKEDSAEFIANRQVLPVDEIKTLDRPVLAHRPILHEEVRLQGRSQEQVVEEMLDAVPVPAAET